MTYDTSRPKWLSVTGCWRRRTGSSSVEGISLPCGRRMPSVEEDGRVPEALSASVPTRRLPRGRRLPRVEGDGGPATPAAAATPGRPATA
jgi:hypothetical protein